MTQVTAEPASFTIPARCDTWQAKVRYVWAAKRKLYALAKDAKADSRAIDEEAFYALLTEIGHARSRLRKRQMPADLAHEDALHDDAKGNPADRPSQKAMATIVRALTKADLDGVDLPSVRKAEAA